MRRSLPAKRRIAFISSLGVAVWLLLVSVIPAAAQRGAASIEFLVQATPTSGRPEKVMRQPFYLLRASLAEIEKEAAAEMALPDFDAFADNLNVSNALKAWMKREKRADLKGSEFIKAVTVDDIMTVPEFKEAYVTRNLTMVGLGFPRHPKFSGKEKDRAKYDESVARYWEAVKAYATAHPESKEQMDDHLVEINPGAAWQSRLEAHQRAVRQKMEQLIYARYLAGRTETDYEGMARFSGLAPGRYWLTNLWTEARAGDVHLRWEVPVELAAGQSLYLELNNANALLPKPR
ncbi:MAG TPA: hypothetical protein VNN18_12340 [Candidatus Xenobia bacterium]|nr:hypothetical protein [Candidatus Xenobia bacterium]